MSKVIKFKAKHKDFKLPEIAIAGSACFDMRYYGDQALVLPPQDRMLVPLGCSVEIPEGHELQLRPRSGLAAKHGITLLNAPGTIDYGYTGLLQAIIANLGKEEFVIEPGMRVCQARLAELVPTEFALVDELSTSERGEGGLGSTGLT